MSRKVAERHGLLAMEDRAWRGMLPQCLQVERRKCVAVRSILVAVGGVAMMYCRANLQLAMPMLPKISIVTPSFNQAQFLERTITSVLDQGYANLEYIVIDGGSTDGSVEIIRKYSNRLAYWTSEPDGGQSEAINKGLRRATGDWVAWQNSDDVYYPGTFAGLARAITAHPGVHLITGDMVTIDVEDKKLHEHHYVRPTFGAIRAEGMIVANQAAFWHKDVHKSIGYLSESLSCAFDYEWFLRVTKHFRAWHVPVTWGGLRLHDMTKTVQLAQRFTPEGDVVRAAYPFPSWKIPLYRLRRVMLMLMRGDAGHLIRRATGRFVSVAARETQQRGKSERDPR
jgi:glycosyltransferase involved in cell wall biosynthesis